MDRVRGTARWRAVCGSGRAGPGSGRARAQTEAACYSNHRFLQEQAFFVMRQRSLRAIVPALLGCGLALLASTARAEPPETAPEVLTQILDELEIAASGQDLQTVMGYYSPEFATADGMTHATLSMGLTQLWETYDAIAYDVELVSWERDGADFVTETVTRIEGTRREANRDIRLTSEVVSRQRIRDGLFAEQTILAESSQLASGENPPKVSVSLPQTVRPGETFSFDVVVQEPLGDDVLLGGVTEEVATDLTQLVSGELDLDVLPAGGIFQVGTAPEEPGDRWLSAVLIRKDGFTVVTQRLRVVAGE